MAHPDMKWKLNTCSIAPNALWLVTSLMGALAPNLTSTNG